ncbi:hypothetical protein FHR24_000177 [Wenyingzhuangia heitensis]|uniref:MepB protein n=1 Tax=Wenyingzhuangia heitensis TaxID=1487859 RepID=A0ABX0U4E0_9FLAO|nr:MepB family protein [Wenyingzhuangia heitensis]NIJ43738.1 hypothetical protein [Wenyingzhuangia heitensis]
MDVLLCKIKLKVFDACGLKFDNFFEEKESKEYKASQFTLESRIIKYRTAKKTPKKIGQFVTFYKRNLRGVIEPFYEEDTVDFYFVSVENQEQLGFFMFPKSELIKRGIISTKLREGKRAFRVYSLWDLPTSKQAMATQKWQSNYFYEVTRVVDKSKLVKMF